MAPNTEKFSDDFHITKLRHDFLHRIVTHYLSILSITVQKYVVLVVKKTNSS